MSRVSRVQGYFPPVTITHNPLRFSEMSPWLKGYCTVMYKISKGALLSQSMGHTRVKQVIR